MKLEFPNCIICNNDSFEDYLSVLNREDNQTFSLVKCKCSLVMTRPRPCAQSIHRYNDLSYSPHANAKKNISF